MQAAVFLSPKTSPAGPLWLLWGQGGCCCLEMASPLWVGSWGMRPGEIIHGLANLLMTLVKGPRFILVWCWPRR